MGQTAQVVRHGLVLGGETIAGLFDYDPALIALPVGYVVDVLLDTGTAGVWIGTASGLVMAAVLLVERIRCQFRRLDSPATTK